MKLLITGGYGFIGSWVIREALQRGHEVVNVDALTYAANASNLESVQENSAYRFEHVDIRDRGKLREIFAKHKPDSIMHLAAESHVDRSIDAPAIFIETNIFGTYNLLEEARNFWEELGRPSSFKFHHVSTDEVFGSLSPEKTDKFIETTSYDPRSPYSASKASADHLVRAWYHTYDLPVVLTNCSNNYGPYHFPEKLIPVVIINALQGSTIPIYGDGSNIRDWLYVEDHASALLLVLEQGEVGRSYNIGGESERTNLQLVTAICEILDRLQPRPVGSYANLIEFVSDRPGHDRRYAIDASRIRTELGWTPSVTLELGLEKTVRWYIENTDWWEQILRKHDVSRRLGTH